VHHLCKKERTKRSMQLSSRGETKFVCLVFDGLHEEGIKPFCFLSFSFAACVSLYTGLRLCFFTHFVLKVFLCVRERARRQLRREGRGTKCKSGTSRKESRTGMTSKIPLFFLCHVLFSSFFLCGQSFSSSVPNPPFLL